MNVFQIKVLWKEQTSSPAHNDNLNWIEKFQYATAATAAATSSSIYSISIQARCCFALFHPQHNCGYMCSFTWAQKFVFGSIGSISLAYSLNEILDHVLNECCTERTVFSFRSYSRKSKYCEGDRRPIVVLDWTLNGVGTSWVEWGVSGPGHLTPGWEAQCTGNVTAGTDSAGIALSLKRTFCICPKNTLVWAHSCQGSLSSYPKISHDVTFRHGRYLFVWQNPFPSCQMMVIKTCWGGFEVTHHKIALKQTM